MLMGLTLAGCPASDDTSETMGNGETSSTTTSTTSTTDDSGSTTTFDPSTGPVGEAYGNPETTDTLGTSSSGDTEGTSSGTGGASSGTDSGTGTDGGSSTGISPDYGVPTTGE